ncbi:MAG TPA: DUF1674 domain-containing protein [Hyphomicrobiaceae bacterium]|nr:DUF1674 domain-containing protein [Hyphomicrobiaceae bacterium]
MSDKAGIQETPGGGARARPLAPAARRALEEAGERRSRSTAKALGPAPEVGGRQGPEPTRYGDWESGGLITDF